MERRVEDRKIELGIGERQVVEFCLEEWELAAESREVMARGGQPVERIIEQVHGGRPVTSEGQPIGKPPGSRAEIKDVETFLRLSFYRGKDVPFEVAVTLAAHLPLRGQVTREVFEGQRQVVGWVCAAASFDFTDRQVFVEKALVGPSAVVRQGAKYTTVVLESKPA